MVTVQKITEKAPKTTKRTAYQNQILNDLGFVDKKDIAEFFGVSKTSNVTVRYDEKDMDLIIENLKTPNFVTHIKIGIYPSKEFYDVRALNVKVDKIDVIANDKKITSQSLQKRVEEILGISLTQNAA